MEQYMPKSALVAEIDRLVNNYDKALDYEAALEDVRNFLDTLEVKEVDLEKTINDYFKNWKFDEELDIMVKPNNYSATFDDIKEVAKHFFELGLRSTITEEDCKLIWNIGDEIPNIPEEEFYKEVLKRFQDYKERKEK